MEAGKKMDMNCIKGLLLILVVLSLCLAGCSAEWEGQIDLFLKAAKELR